MRKREIHLVLGITFLVVLLLLGCQFIKTYMDYWVPVSSIGRIMGVAIVENLDFLEGKEKRTDEKNPGVCMSGVLLPYTADGTLYLAQDFTKTKWEGDLLTDSKDTYLCTLPDVAWQDKATSIRDGHVFQIWLVGEDYYYELDLVVSGMPVMTISTERFEKQDLGDYETDPDRFSFEPEILYYGDIQVFDPGDEMRWYDIFESGVRYYHRGASSALYDKKSYSISLLDSKGDKLDKSLLGMRFDNTWKLKSLVTDESRIREKTSCEIWEALANTNDSVNESGPRMEYLELIVDNDYVGLYGIVEPVDEEKLGLDKNDVLYKSTNRIVPSDEDIQEAIDRKWKVMTFFRIRYPDPILDYAKTWYPMRDYLNTFYRGGGDERPIESKISLSNFIDMHIFNMTISGSDNYLKNLYFVADVGNDGSYTMRVLPWDLDLTFGLIIDSGGGAVSDETVVYEEAALPLLRDMQPELVRPLMQKRWEECRQSFLSTDNILNIMRENQSYLINTGVVARENQRWPEYRMDADIESIENYQIRRMEFLDEFYGGF